MFSFRTLFLASLACTALLASCNDSVKKAPDTFDEALLAGLDSVTLRNHLMVLSHDSLEGRAPGTAGEKKTIDYIVKNFKEAGLEPAFDNSYTQDVPLIGTKVEGTPQIRVIDTNGKESVLKFVDDFRVFTDFEEGNVKTDAEIVFAGYGIHAPEYNWNDFDGVDINGKVVMVFDGEPGATEAEPYLFKADTLTYYGRPSYKVEEARRRGAAGILVIENPVFFARNRMRSTVEQIQLSHMPEGRLETKMYLSYDAAVRIAQMAGLNVEKLREISLDRSLSAQPLNLTLKSDVDYHIRPFNGQNVGAVLRGYERPDEKIIITAHHDHLGIGIPNAAGDSIYNGAIDNASGTATVLTLAQNAGKMPYKPKRSVMFLTLTAEESGLLGAYYYSYNPAFPIAKTVANINIDCTNMFAPTIDITAVGVEFSDLGGLLEKKAAKEGLAMAPFTNVGGGIFYRSDQLPFALAGVPALYVLSGPTYVPGYEDFAAEKAAAYGGSYHQPSDNFDPEWMMEGTLQQARVVYRMIYSLAQSDEWPQWTPGFEFEALRKETDNQRK